MSLVFSVFSALWLGILTSISPCPLASNIAAVSFILKNTGKVSFVFGSGILYTIGRSLAYTVLGALCAFSILEIPQSSFFLQTYMNKLLGPVLIIVGCVMLEFFPFSFPSFAISNNLGKKIINFGTTGPVLLGGLFALSFCPVSAALFFGSLIPLSLTHRSTLLLPFVYGIGTGVPVLVFSLIIAAGLKNMGRVFQRVATVDKWSRKITGTVFILIGVYFVLEHIFSIDVI